MPCCVCLLNNPDIIGVFDAKGQKLKVAEIIHKHLWFKPQPNDLRTSKICIICWHKIDDFHIFYQMVEKAHNEYKNMQRTQSDDIKLEEKPSSSSIKMEPDEEVFERNLMQVEAEIDETKNPLEEGQNDGDGDDDDDASNDDESENECDDGGSSDDYEPSEISDAESLIEEEIANDIETEENDGHTKTATAKKPPNKRKAVVKNSDKINNPAKKKRTINRSDPQVTDEMIKKYIPMGCNLCVFVGETFADIVEHFKVVHPNVRPFIMCCDKKLTKRFYVAQHALKHDNPNCFRCAECNKTFTTICGLRTHNLSYHAPEEELKFECDLCPKKFARKNLLDCHKPSHIPREQWEYVCSKCSPAKTFASQNFLNIHTSMQHKREKNVCHVCAKEIRDKHSFEKHVRSHFGDYGPRVKCPYPNCESWLKDEDNLKQHLQRHNPEGKTFKCDLCDKFCTNRRALTNHKRYSHSNETFQCEQCMKSFKKAISLREHMTQHTGETLYKCPFCPRTFNSNANMHSHKKKQHPIEWEEWRKSKRGSAQTVIDKTNPFNQTSRYDTLPELDDVAHLFP